MNRRQQRVNLSEQGFTLMEVMVVTAIVGIMAAIAIPNYLSWKPGYEFRGAVSRISSDLNKAKMRALEIRRESRVVFCNNAYQIIDGDKTMGSDWSLVAGNNNACLTTAQQATLEAAGRRVRNVSLADYNMVVATVNNELIFSPRGLSSLATVTVTHTGSNDSVPIAINQTGRVNVGW